MRVLPGCEIREDIHLVKRVLLVYCGSYICNKNQQHSPALWLAFSGLLALNAAPFVDDLANVRIKRLRIVEWIAQRCPFHGCRRWLHIVFGEITREQLAIHLRSEFGVVEQLVDVGDLCRNEYKNV